MTPSRYARKSKTRTPKKLYIAPEGTKTEYNYFAGLKKVLRKEHIDIIPIKRDPKQERRGTSPDKILALAVDYCQKNNVKISEYIRVAIVVDYDRWSKLIPKTYKEANQRKFDFYVSNPCIELWFVLHDHLLSEEEKRELTTCAKCKQLWNEIFKGNYEGLYPLTTKAIENAKVLDKDCNSAWPLEAGTHIYKIFNFLELS